MKSFAIAGTHKVPAIRTTQRQILIIALLLIIDALGIPFIYSIAADGLWSLALVLALVMLGIHLISFLPGIDAYHWLAPGLILLVLFVVYPLIFTLYISLTNYSDGNLISKTQAIERITDVHETAPGSPVFEWAAFRHNHEIRLLLRSESGEQFLAIPGKQIQFLSEGDASIIQRDAAFIRGSALMNSLAELQSQEFPADEGRIRIQSLQRAVLATPRYRYLQQNDMILDTVTGTMYQADNSLGLFISPEAQILRPGYQVFTGFANYRRIFTSPLMRGPLLSVFSWTFIFAALSTLLTFALGLMLAMVMEDTHFPGRGIIQSILILPQAIPGVISIMVWRGLLNPREGVINHFLTELLGWAPQWFADPLWAKIAVLGINLWLGYPYMYLVSSGALKSIPRELFEAAGVDGAGRIRRFFSISLPMLLVSMGPLLVSTFTFNLNNFNVIYLFNEGGPPIVNAPTPAGHTDILISYTYRLAFASQRGSDYGFAAAITAIIFLILCTVTILNFRFTRIWEETSENV